MNINKIKNNNPDLKIRKLIINNKNINIIYFETLCNSSDINDFILRPIINDKLDSIKKIKDKLPSSNIVLVKDEKELLFCLYSGFTIISIDNEYISFETKYSLDSGINEATNEKVIKGPKDAFTENYQNNIGLIRKRIRSNKLVIKEYIIGSISKSKVSFIYLEDKCDKELVLNIDTKLKNMNIEYVLNSNYIIDNLEETKTLFPTNIMTERPDLVSFCILEGRCSFIVENSPQAVIIPAFFTDYMKTVDDYYQNNINVILTRIIRIISFIIAIITPGLYIALTTFNQETLPTSVLINFSMQREGVPFPSFIEALLLWLSFEILREADTRVPFVVGSSMSIVGALVLGQAAVEAGLISPIMIIVIAISSVASFLFNDNDIVNAIRIWKLIFLLLGSFVGLYGIFIGTLLFIIRICSIKSFGYDFILKRR